jgi:hypothetical protein
MILSIILIVLGIVSVVAIMIARAKNNDSTGPMNNN